MHIALDIDDTITRCPEFFSVITRALMTAGHKVYIISYREDRGFAEEDLSEHGITYDELILPAAKDLQPHGDRSWKDMAAEWKAEVCRRLEIEILFDDMPEVVNALHPGTCAFMPVDKARGKVGYSAAV